MSRNLPALPVPAEIEPEQARRSARSSGGMRRWLRSPIAAALAEVTPDLLRAAGQAAQSRNETGNARSLANLPPAGANGLSVSEVEIAMSAPFVRRVVVRTATAWSIAPEVLLAEKSRKRRAGRYGIGAAGVAGLAMLGLAAVRRKT